MRILTVTSDFPSPADTQEGIFMLRQMKAIADRGHDVAVFRVIPFQPAWLPASRAYSAIPGSYEIEGLPVRSVRALVPPRRIGLEFIRHQVAGALRREIARFRADVLHAQYILPGGTYAVGHGVPAVVTAHGSDAYDWPWQRPGLRRAAERVCRKADQVVAVSAFIKGCVERLGRRDVPVVFNGGSDIFVPSDREAAKAALGVDARRPAVTFVGHLIPTKGVRELVEAMRSLADLRPVLLVAGDGPERGLMQSALDAAGIEHRIVGFVGQAEVARLYAAADVVTLPSYEEGLPVVLCEAMLAARAIVASPVGGIPEIVRDGVTGRIVPPREVAPLAAALRDVLTSAATRRAYEEAAFAFAAGRLTWRANAAAYEEIYRAVTARAGVDFARAR